MSDISILAQGIDRLRGVNVLCVGDVMLDQFVYGTVDRISPEAPIPVLRILRETAMLGGAGNVVRNLVALGAGPCFVAVVGDDVAGREVSRLVGDQDGVDPRIVVERGRQTTIKTRFFAGGQQLLRGDRETAMAVSPSASAEVIEDSERLIASCALVILSDYGKGVLTPDIVRRIIGLARQHRKPVVVDPKGIDYTIYAGATLVTPNRKELQDATGLPVDSDDEVVAAARQLIDKAGIANVLVTRSQDGMTLVTGAGAVDHLPAEAREVFDVSGAGDTVIATVSACIAAGLSLLDAARLANVAAGIVVGKIGTAVAHADDLVAALHHDEIRAGEAKVLALDALLDKVEVWRRKGCRIGFTNGCFDLLHPGHVSLLAQARAACDRLVVGLNSDSSVQRLKGPARPVQSEAARSTVLASLADVDAVAIFNEDTPMRLIEAIKPDVLIKGADYTVETVVGASVVQSYGGRILLARLEDGFSTTATIARMNK